MGQEFSVEDTVLIYLFTFGISFVMLMISKFFWKTEIIDGKSRKKMYIFGVVFFFLSVLSICILAGIRGDNVGTDTSGYGIQAIRLTQGRTFTRYMMGRSEFSFYGLAYMISIITRNETVWLGLIELLVALPVFYIIYKESSELSVSLALFVFLFKFYNYSLCIMRQSIACSFVLLASYFFIKKKYFLFVIFGIIAIGFHNTAFIGLIGYILISSIVNNSKKDNRSSKILMVIFGLLVILIVFLPRITSYIFSLSFIPSYYKKFIVIESGTISRYGFFETISRIALLIVIIYILRKKRMENIFIKNMLFVSVAGCGIYSLCDFTWGMNTVYRITEYFDYAFIFSISIIPDKCPIVLHSQYKGNTPSIDRISKYRGKIVMTITVALSLFLYWLFVYFLMPDALGFQTEHFSLRV